MRGASGWGRATTDAEIVERSRFMQQAQFRRGARIRYESRLPRILPMDTMLRSS